MVPPRDAAHHTARYGTIKLLWLFGHSQHNAGVAEPAGDPLDRVRTPLMKPQRLMYSPTRSRRLNEMLGLIVLVVAGLLLLALVSYTPSDPSFNTVGGGAGTHLAHNWTGLVGAYYRRPAAPDARASPSFLFRWPCCASGYPGCVRNESDPPRPK